MRIFVAGLVEAGARHHLAVAVGQRIPLREQGFRRRVGQVHALGEGHVRQLVAARARAQDRAGRRSVGDQRQQRRAHQRRIQRIQLVLRQDAFHHPRVRGRREAVDADPVALAFQRQRLHQPDQRHFRRPVVGLAEVAVQPGRGRGHHDAAMALCAHRFPDRLAAVGRAHQVHVDHRAEVGEVELGEGLVAQDAGIVDQDVDAAPLGDHAIDHRLHRVGIGDRTLHGARLTAGGHDLGGHRVGARAEVVHHHACAAPCEQQGVLAAKTAARAGDDGDAASQVDHVHAFRPRKDARCRPSPPRGGGRRRESRARQPGRCHRGSAR